MPFRSSTPQLLNLSFAAADQLINLSRQRAILFRHFPAGIMGIQPDLYGVVGIGPGGMVVGLFRGKRHARHEGKSFGEVSEFKFAVKPFSGFLPGCVVHDFFLLVKGRKTDASISEFTSL